VNLAMSEPLDMQSWFLSLAVTSALVATALVYVRGWFSLRRSFPDLIGRWRLGTFTIGLVSVWTAVASPLATLDHQSLTIHMMKHLLLMTVAAPLLLAGAPVFPLVCGLPKLFIKRYPPLASLRVRWLERCLMPPVLCWLAGTAAVIGWHLPVMFHLGMRSHWLHNLEDLCFLVACLLFWWPIVQCSPSAARSPRWSMALYLFLATLPCDILSAFLVFCGRPVYTSYLSTTQLFGVSPLQDQECAGALMWVWVTFAYLIPAVVMTVQILSPSNTHRQRSVQTALNSAVGQSLNGAEVL
jgi:putative membrane protein